MFPVTDFHFVFGGFAAVAATVGYRFARKKRTSLSASDDDAHDDPATPDKSGLAVAAEKDSGERQSPASRTYGLGFTRTCKAVKDIEKASDATQPGTLKRKNTEDDHYNNDSGAFDFGLENANPTKKRSTTPPHPVASIEFLPEPTPAPVAATSVPVPVPQLKRKSEWDEDVDGDTEATPSSPPKKRSRSPSPEPTKAKLPTAVMPPPHEITPAPLEDEYVVVTTIDDEVPTRPVTPTATETDVERRASTPPPADEAETPRSAAPSPPSAGPTSSDARALSPTPELQPAEPSKAEADAEALFRYAEKLRRAPVTPPRTPEPFALRPSILGRVASPPPRPATPPSQPVEFTAARGFGRTASPFGASVNRVTPKTLQAHGGGFASFAGSTSAPFARTGSPSPLKRSVWSGGDAGSSLLHKATTPVFVREDTEPIDDPHASSASTPVPAATSRAQTGEEGEEVLAEVKSVKLYVKRGEKPFGGGMSGTLRHLVHKETQSERLLFRREPLWQPTMNATLSPALRCTFDAEEQVLRVSCLEPVVQQQQQKESSGEAPEKIAHEVVVYALKGRSADADSGRPASAFRTVAEGVIGNHHLKPTL